MSQPFVVCICPTRGRLPFLREAIANFARQTYPHRELLILADSHEEGRAIRTMVEDERVVTMAVTSKMSIGEKRNVLCEQARSGSIICHWDDDDWYGPERIAEQVAIMESGAMLTGYDTVLFADDERQEVWRFRGDRLNLIGVSLMYRRERWLSQPFNQKSIGEDNDFVAADTRGIVAQSFGSIVARIHPGNTSPKRIRDMQVWSQEPWEAALELGYEPMAEKMAV